MSINELIAEAIERFKQLTPEQQQAMRDAQRKSWVRSIVDWPKPKFKWVNGAKVYGSYEDYCND